jgi:GT2 family glycosyltransferase
MINKKPDVSVIITNWNVGELLINCLRSLGAGLGDIQSEIIVVDNASVDNSVELVRENFSSVKVIANSENIGFSRANNMGIKKSKGRYVLLLNPDTVVSSGTVEKLVRFMDSSPDAGLAGCKQIYASGELQTTCHRMITLKRECLVALGLSKIFTQIVDYGDLPMKATEPLQVDWVGGACLIVRRHLIERIGLFDEKIFMYGEDCDLCYRIKNLGYAVYYLPGLSIIHHRNQSAAKLSEFYSNIDHSRLYLQFVSRKYVIKKHYGNLQGNIYHVLIILAVVRKILQDSLTHLLPHSASSRSALSSRRREYLAVLRSVLKGKI